MTDVPPAYPPIEPYRTGHLPVDSVHTLYWEECGNPNGVPVLFLHGGPGSGLSPKHRQFFDPAYYRIVLFDQRGAGQSTPLGEYRDNTTPLLIADIERLREWMGIAQWLFSDDPALCAEAARTWSRYEGSCLHLLPHPEVADEFGSEAVSLGVGRLEAHYFRHRGFLSDDQLIRGVDRIRHLPAVIIQGRYDVVCPPTSAWRLHQVWPEASFEIIEDAGHAAFEPGIARALVAATERFKQTGTL